MTKKRLLAFVLALVMLLSVLPVTAMAEAVEPVPVQQTEEETPAPAPEEPKTEQPQQPEQSEQPQEPQQPEQPQPQLEAQGEENAPVVTANGPYYWAIVNSGSDVKLVISDTPYQLAEGETAYPVDGNKGPTSGVFDGTESRSEYGLWGKYRFMITTAVVQGNVAPTNTAYWFYECKKLTSVDLSKLDTSNVTDMSRMFSECQKLVQLEGISDWNVSKVERMTFLFHRCYALPSLDISGWNTSSVTNMFGMFSQCERLTEVELGAGWNTGSVTDMETMFKNCRKLASLDISGWNTSRVTRMNFMFEDCKALTSLNMSGLNLLSVRNFEQMFGTYGNSSGIYAVDFTGVTVPKKEPSSAIQMCSNAVAYVSTAGSVKTKAGGDWLVAHEGFVAVTNGGTFSSDTTFQKGKLATPSREGYDFVGWYTKPECTGDTVTDLVSRNRGATYYAKWEQKPAQPEKLSDLAPVMVMVECADNVHTRNFFGIPDNICTLNSVEKKNGAYFFSVTVNDPDSFLAGYNNVAESGGPRKHVRVSDGNENMTITWKWVNNNWVCQNPDLSDGKAAAPAVLKVRVKCVYNVTFDAKGGTPAPAAQEVQRNATAARPAVDPEKTDCRFLGWFDKNGHEFDFTTPITGDITLTAKWQEKQTAQLVIYRNGDTTNAYKTVSLGKMYPGTVIDLTKLNIADYYTGDVDFYGWYNDGTWNTYKKNVAAGKGAPAGLKEIKVNGWTNIICMVYDLDKVVYFQSAEDLAAYQKDHSKTDAILHTTTVRRGTALPTADAPTATRDGYTFKYWSREGQNVDVTGQTVSGWTNLYAAWEINTYKVTFDPDNGEKTFTNDVKYNDLVNKPTDPTKAGYTFDGWYKEDGTKWNFDEDRMGAADMKLTAQWTITPHDIYAFTNVNSCFVSLTPDMSGLKDRLTLRENTLSRLGLSYNDNGYVSISKFSFNGMPLTEDLYMAYYDDAEVDAVVAALKDKGNAGSLEVSKDIANRVDWQSLYKTVNEEDMPAGYPTKDEDSYQLYGNLELATVMFDAGANDVENMPAVNYTYDDIIDIYDFYFDGDTFTLPADPTRTGYTFQGWSAEVIPADNDAECNDADTDADADAEKLYKAGDTYEITGGGVKFTAQWEKKTYNISATLYLNGADKDHPVLVDDGRYPWSHSYGGKFKETIDYTKMFDTLKAKAMEVDAANGPVDSVVTLRFPGKDKLFNTAVTYYGEDTANWQANNKNTAYIWGFATNVYAVTFDYKIEGNTEVNTTLRVNYNEQVAEPESPTRTGYTFKGWYTDADCTEGNEFVFTTPITKTMTLYAKWQVNQYKVTYDANGGVKADPSEAMVDFGAKVPNSTTTREGYTFQGWFVGDTDVKWDFKNGTMGAEDMTLTAHWQANEYTVTFDANGGEKADPESKTVTYDAEYGELAETSREGYTFLGWFTEEDGGDEVKETTVVKTAKDHTLYAHWQINVYTVKFVSFDKVVETQEVEHGKTATRIKNPEVNDYVFKGWYLNGQLYDFNTPVTSDITLVAQWVTKTPSSNPSTPTKTETKDNGKTVQSGKTFDGGIALYVGLSVLSVTGSAWVITKKKRG